MDSLYCGAFFLRYTVEVMKAKKPLNVWTTAIPLYFEMVAVNSIGLVDVFFMSLVADKAVAALGACTQVILVFTLLSRTLCGGAGSIAGQSIGAKNRVRATLAFMYAMLIAIVFGAVFAAMLYVGRSLIPTWMGLQGEALGYASTYLAILGPAFFLLSLRLGYSTIVAVKGKSRVNLICALISNAVNLALNAIFVLGLFGAPKLGVVGVALATAVSHLVYLLAIAWVAHKYLHVRFIFVRRVVDRLHELTRPVLGIAIPNCGDLLSYTMFQVVMVSIVIRIDELAAAAYTYVHQAMMFSVLWSFSVSQGQAIWTAHLVGARQYDKVESEVKRSILRCLIFAMPITLVLYSISGQLFPLFSDNPAIVSMATTAMLAYLGIEIGRAFNATLSFSLAAAGDARYPAILGFIFNWLVGVPVAWFMGVHLGWGLIGALAGVAADELVRSPLNYYRLVSRRWIKYPDNQAKR